MASTLHPQQIHHLTPVTSGSRVRLNCPNSASIVHNNNNNTSNGTILSGSAGQQLLPNSGSCVPMPLMPVVATKGGSGESLQPVSTSNDLNLASALASLLGLPFASNLLPVPALSSSPSSASSAGSTAVTSNQYQSFSANRIHDSNIISPSNLAHQFPARDPAFVALPRNNGETRENNYRQQAVLSNTASDNNPTGSNPHVFSFNFVPQTQTCSDVSSDTGSVQSPFPSVNQTLPTSSAVDNNNNVTGSDTYYNSFRRFSVDTGDLDICDPASNSSERDRKQREFIPESKKDDKYWERRRKNNEAAKRSREKRRQNDILMEQQINILNAQNHKLRRDLLELKLRFGVPLDDDNQDSLSTTDVNYAATVDACKLYCNGQSETKDSTNFNADQGVVAKQSPTYFDAHSQEDQLASPSSLRNMPKLDEMTVNDDHRMVSPITSLNGIRMGSATNANYLGTPTVTTGNNTLLTDQCSPPTSSIASFYSPHPSISSHAPGVERYSRLPVTATNNINGMLPPLDNGPAGITNTNLLNTNDLVALRRIFSTLIMNKETTPGAELASTLTGDNKSMDRQLFCHTSPLPPLALLPTDSSDPLHNQLVTAMLPDPITGSSAVNMSNTSAASWLFRQAALIMGNNQHLSADLIASCASSPHSTEPAGGHEQVPPPLGANIAASRSLEGAPVMKLLSRLPPVMVTSLPSVTSPSVRQTAGAVEVIGDSPLDLRLGTPIAEAAANLPGPVLTSPGTTKSSATTRPPGTRDRTDMKMLDKRYQDRRRRNNEAVRRCRENKRARLLGRAEVTDRLHTENQTLRSELTDLSMEVKALRKLLSSDNFPTGDRTDLLKALHLVTTAAAAAAAVEEELPVSRSAETLSSNESTKPDQEFAKQPAASETVGSPFTASLTESFGHRTQDSATLSTIHSSCSDMDGDEEGDQMCKDGKHDATQSYYRGNAIIPCLDQEHQNNGITSENQSDDHFNADRKSSREPKTNGVNNHHHHARSSKYRQRIMKRNSCHTFSSRHPTGSDQAWPDCRQSPSKTAQLLNTCDFLSAGSKKDKISS